MKENVNYNSTAAKNFEDNLNQAVKNAGTTVPSTTDKAKTAFTKSKDSILKTIDTNGNGEVDIEDFIIIGLKTPAIKVNREAFLQRELMKNYPCEVIESDITHNPAYAQIPACEIDKIADKVINFERNCVSGISASLGAHGGAAMVAAIHADLVQYYGYMMRDA